MDSPPTRPVLKLACAFVVGLLSGAYLRDLWSDKIPQWPSSSNSVSSTYFAPALSSLSKIQVRFTGGPAFDANGTMYVPCPSDPVYTGDPDPAIDAAWDKLLLGKSHVPVRGSIVILTDTTTRSLLFHHTVRSPCRLGTRLPEILLTCPFNIPRWAQRIPHSALRQ